MAGRPALIEFYAAMKTKTESTRLPVPTLSDTETIRRSRPEDYDGHTGFDRMTPAARLAWLESAVDFISRRGKPFGGEKRIT